MVERDQKLDAVIRHILDKQMSQAVPKARAGMSVETGWRVGVAESMDDMAAPAVGTGILFATFRSSVWLRVIRMSVG